MTDKTLRPPEPPPMRRVGGKEPHPLFSAIAAISIVLLSVMVGSSVWGEILDKPPIIIEVCKNER